MPEPTRWRGIHPESDTDVQLLQREIEWALGQARALAEDRELAKDQAGPLARALERVLEQALERARGEPLTKMLTWAEARPPFTYAYGQILADSKLKDIIDCIELKHRHGLACALSQDPFALQVWWLIQIITPINRLTSDLFRQILLILMDNLGHSPLPLMLVCKHWYTIVTGIWASLKLGTTTSKGAVETKLEKNQ